MKILNKQLLIGLLLGLLAAPQLTLAATAATRLKNVVAGAPTYDVDKTDQNTLTNYVGAIIGVFLGLLGTIFIILIIYGGYTWMTAAGNVEKVAKAGRVLKASILGLLIVIAVYAMWYFLFDRIVKL